MSTGETRVRLAELRERRALTLRELSEMSGVAADTINQIELGQRKARPSTLRKLAKALDVEVREFFEELRKARGESLSVTEQIHNPDHYGGAGNPYECIRVLEAWGCGFNLGNCIKYLNRAGKKGDRLTDLKKALWYLQREINRCEGREGFREEGHE